MRSVFQTVLALAVPANGISLRAIVDGLRQETVPLSLPKEHAGGFSCHYDPQKTKQGSFGAVHKGILFTKANESRRDVAIKFAIPNQTAHNDVEEKIGERNKNVIFSPLIL